MAMLNIWIPQCVGEIINVITRVRHDGKASYNGGDSLTSVFQQLAEPAFKLARMYVAQVCKFHMIHTTLFRFFYHKFGYSVFHTIFGSLFDF